MEPMRGRFRLYSRRREGGIWAANLSCVAFSFPAGVTPILGGIVREWAHVAVA